MIVYFKCLSLTWFDTAIMLKTLSVLLACYVCVNGVDDRTVELESPEADEELVTPSPMLTTPTPPLSKERASCHQDGNDR